MDNLIYFDYAATTPVRRESMDAMMEALWRFGNPSSQYSHIRRKTMQQCLF